MILGRAAALWLGFLQALGALIVAGVLLYNGQDIGGVVSTVLGFVSAIIGILANRNTPGTVPTFSLRRR